MRLAIKGQTRHVFRHGLQYILRNIHGESGACAFHVYQALFQGPANLALHRTSNFARVYTCMRTNVGVSIIEVTYFVQGQQGFDTAGLHVLFWI